MDVVYKFPPPFLYTATERKGEKKAKKRKGEICTPPLPFHAVFRLTRSDNEKTAYSCLEKEFPWLNGRGKNVKRAREKFVPPLPFPFSLSRNPKRRRKDRLLVLKKEFPCMDKERGKRR